jgi:16S rRNA (cytosine967-C5)-methyltransferase
MTTAREVAARVLVRVEKEGAFASAALEAELSRAVQLDARDRALATELAYGSLRVMPWLDEQLERFAPQGTKKLDARVRAHLIAAAYQLAFTRVPAFAAVNEAVDAVRRVRGDRLAAFANAVLRKFAKYTSELGHVDRELAIAASTPAWLRDALDRVLSPAGTRSFVQCGVEPPAVALRVEQPSERDAWLARLRKAAPAGRFETGSVSPLAILVRGAGKPQQLVGYQEGAWSVQEEGAQLAALAVGAEPGEIVLDACAGRGNKAALLARQVGIGGAVDVCDAIPSKLDHLRAELARCHLSVRASYAIDWRVGSGELVGEYDRVFVDAPCSGTGTLRRRPEIALRRESPDLAAMAALQIAIASRAAAHVRRGGALFYVVCSILREEAEDVIDEVVRKCSGLSPAPFDSPAARAIAADAPSFRLLPHVHGTDGYFVAKLARL